METLNDLVINITKILDELDIRYYITGSFALGFWGNPRTTHDIDLVIQMESKNISQLVEKLKFFDPIGYVDGQAIHEALERSGEWNFIHGETGTKVDFWISKHGPWNLEAMKRRQPIKVKKSIIYVISPEDLILAKLVWHKKSGSARQLEDAESVLKISGDQLDKKYLTKWAKQLDVLEILNDLWDKTI